MTFSQDCIDLTKQFESLRHSAYRDAGGKLTIGWGHTSGVYEGQTCTDAEAESFLGQDLFEASTQLEKLLSVSLSQHQFDALCDFVFNLGAGNFEGSTLRRCVNTENWEAAANQILLWDHEKVNDVEVEEPGLKARRTAERNLFLEG